VRLDTASSRHPAPQLEPKDKGPWSQVRVRDCSWRAAPELVFQLNFRAATAHRDRHLGEDGQAPISGPGAEISRARRLAPVPTTHPGAWPCNRAQGRAALAYTPSRGHPSERGASVAPTGFQPWACWQQP
jgi:hypothetical protein